MKKELRKTNDKVEIIVSGQPLSKKPYSAPEIIFMENIEAVAGSCDKGYSGCPTGASS
jgi:hypothetical protein